MEYKFTKTITMDEVKIPKFSVNIKFKDQPQTMVNVENKYVCNASTMRECKLDDPRTLFGCQEFSVRCHHFNQDFIYLEDKERKIIPKNTDSNTGYALAIDIDAKVCNPYHGELTLVSLNTDSDSYMLICKCKKPGYIGNDTLLGACDKPYICNGNVDNINQPLNEIKCNCSNTEISYITDEQIPACRPMLIKDANEKYEDWTNLIQWGDQPKMSIDKFTPTIQQNSNTKYLLDMCRASLLGDGQIIPNSKYNDQIKSCTYKDYGIPVKIGMLGSEHLTANGTDAVLPTAKWKSLRFIDNVGSVKKQTTVQTEMLFYEPKTTVHVMFPSGMTLSDGSQISITTKDQMLGGKCVGTWPSYSCYLSQNYSYKKRGIPFTDYRPAPAMFFWGFENWDRAEHLIDYGLEITPDGVSINQNHFNARPNLKPYGLQLCQNDTENCLNGPLSFNNEADYNLHKQILV